MTLRRTIFQPDREQEFPDDEIAMLEHQGLLLPPEKAPAPEREQSAAASTLATTTATVAAPAAASKEASTDGGK